MNPNAEGAVTPFGARLREAVARRGRLCVGIDPHAALLQRWGLDDDVNGLAQFTRTVVEALAERVAVVKPQSAFFERFGSRGIAILESAIGDLRAAGALVLLDVKRGDVGSTIEGYADAYLHPSSSLYVDAITASPYPGVGALAPMFARARSYGGGVFVLALTSNPEAATIQRARIAGGRLVAQHVVDEISQLNADDAARGRAAERVGEGAGSFGVVIGATVGAGELDLAGLGGPILAPGLGAQGATAADLAHRFGGGLGAVLPSYSREVLAAGPSVSGLRAAADRALAAIAEVTV